MSTQFQTLALKRGEHITGFTTLTGGDPADWTIEAALGYTRGGNEIADISPTFVGSGWVWDYDTTGLAPRDYWTDIKHLLAGTPVYSETMRVKISEPNTKPD